jgi:UDP-N-acetylglucosamine 2-epimerase (non-hydrolysing)
MQEKKFLVCNVVGARPNFMKIAPIVHEMKRKSIQQFLVHTGQHYDDKMSDVFFNDLGMPIPDIYMGIGSGTHAEQTARIMTNFEKVCMTNNFSLIIVGGDVNSSMACALVASKLHIPVAHVEAGLRSFDKTMPEEINRIVTDHVSDLLFTTEVSANINLKKEGISEDKIYFVGNCMIDTLLKHKEIALSIAPWKEFELEPKAYAILTLHRPSNVDDDQNLVHILKIIIQISKKIKIIFPIHPRTHQQISKLNMIIPLSLILCEPLPYLKFLGLMAKARFMLTDSGGIQEETTILGIPCLTLRTNTERPITIKIGTNRLVGTDSEKIFRCIQEILQGKWKTGKQPDLWDGQASFRIVNIIEKWCIDNSK